MYTRLWEMGLGHRGNCIMLVQTVYYIQLMTGLCLLCEQ